MRFKSDVSGIKSGNKKIDQMSKKNTLYGLKRYKKQETMVLIFMTIILQWYLKQDTKQFKELKILTPNQLLPRLPIVLAELKVGNNSESLLNEINQILYSLYHLKGITKKVYNNIIKSMQI